MALTASCPSCGAAVVFRSASSVFAVCDYCRSTLVRHDRELEDIGKMAALVEDRSPLRLGAKGRYGGVHFALIGRIQVRYGDGGWNEWHLLFDDQRTGWLSEAGGEYVVSFLQPVMEPLPPFDGLQAGQRLALAGQAWTVANIEQAECVGGEGELPFKVGAGYPFAAVDLRNERNFATLDYSETPPLLFVGEAVDFASLAMNGLRDGIAAPERRIEAKVFRCPGCGAPLQARSADILAVGCAACGTVVDATDANPRVLSKALGSRDEKYVPRLPLGTTGTLQGRPAEVIGFLVRQCREGGIAYDWREYLLAGANGTYRWLTEYNGHWNVVEVLSRPPRTSAIEIEGIAHDGRRFRHFSTTARAEVIQVAGELTWRVRRGESCRVVDYVAPPWMLSRESTDRDLNWSLGEYVQPADIAAAFGVKNGLPEPLGIYANQPNPWAGTRGRAFGLFWKLALAALLLQAVFLGLSGERLLLRQELGFAPGQTEAVSRDFTLAAPARKVAVRNRTTLDNNWVGLDLLLVDKASGRAWPAARELAYYHGYDDGYWSEGSRDDEVVFRDVPAGTYYLTVDADLAPEKPGALRDTLEVATAGAGWSNFVLLMIFLAAFPLFAFLRHAAFETGRWAESDHAPEAGDSDGDDD